MAEHDSKSDITTDKAAKTERHYRMGYRPQHGNTSIPALNLSGKWLRDAGFDTGTGFTVKVSAGCLTIIADTSEVRELREELYQVKQVIKGMKEVLV